MFRRALYIPRQLPFHKLTIRSSASIITSHSSRQFHTTEDRSSKATTNKMRDDARDNPVFSSNSHLDTSFAEDPSGRDIHEDDSWKYRAPYQIQKDEEFGPVKWEAMCHCGNVQYQIKQECPLAAKYCHCRACQVLHGMPLPKASNSIMLIFLVVKLHRSNGAPYSAKPTFDSNKALTH